MSVESVLYVDADVRSRVCVLDVWEWMWRTGCQNRLGCCRSAWQLKHFIISQARPDRGAGGRPKTSPMKYFHSKWRRVQGRRPKTRLMKCTCTHTHTHTYKKKEKKTGVGHGHIWAVNWAEEEGIILIQSNSCTYFWFLLTLGVFSKGLLEVAHSL